jgi:hypothetical protein
VAELPPSADVSSASDNRKPEKRMQLFDDTTNYNANYNND